MLNSKIELVMNYIIPEKIDSEKDIELAIYYAQAMSDFSDEMLCKLKQLVTNKDLENRLEDKFFSTFDKIYKSGKNGVDCYSKNGHAVTVLTRQS